MSIPSKFLKVVFLLVILLQAYGAWQIFSINKRQKAYTEDMVELSKIKYGIFNVDEWKEKLAVILAKKIDELEINEDNKEEVRQKIKTFLHTQIRRFRNDFYAENQQSIGGIFRNIIASVTETFDELELYIPVITDEIISLLEDPENRENLKTWVRLKIEEYADQTFSETDYTYHNFILEKYNLPSRVVAIPTLLSKAKACEDEKRPYFILTSVLFGLVLISLLANLTRDRWGVLFSVIYALILLSLGVLLPMIEIDARIDQLSFTLLDEVISFKDQILYYKSKSILEVVGLLIEQGKTDLMLVATLVFLFSVLFPLSKLLATVVYLFREKVQNLSFVRFLVFKTGKWSMADVMVVAIFMAYIGFSGIVTEQLSQLENISTTIDILTTNESKLNEGFFLFTGFVVLGLAISWRVERNI